MGAMWWLGLVAGWFVVSNFVNRPLFTPDVQKVLDKPATVAPPRTVPSIPAHQTGNIGRLTIA